MDNRYWREDDTFLHIEDDIRTGAFDMVDILAIVEHFEDGFAVCYDPASGTLSMEQGDARSTVVIELSPKTTVGFLDLCVRLCEIAHTAIPQVPTVLMEDCPVHSESHPFCGDVSCPCYKDRERKWLYVEAPLLDGLITEDEAVRIFAGKQL